MALASFNSASFSIFEGSLRKVARAFSARSHFSAP